MYLVTSFSGSQLGHYVHDLSLSSVVYRCSSNSERPSQARLALSVRDEKVEKRSIGERLERRGGKMLRHCLLYGCQRGEVDGEW